MTPRYFCGTALGAPVRATSATSFKELVDMCISMPVLINIDRDVFHALPDKERNRKKSVDYLTAACFVTSPSDRVFEKITHCNLIFIDVDSGAEAFQANPQIFVQQLRPFNFCVYHTASSLPAHPRIRVMVDAHEIPKGSYADAVRTVARRLGIAAPTTESLKPGQPMYRPTVFADQQEDTHPWIIGELNTGRPFTVEDLDTTLAPDGTPKQRVDTSDDLFFLRSTLPAITLEIVRDALKHIDADCDRATWLKVCAALKHQFHDQDDEAFLAFDEWSATGSKYVDEDDTLTRWRSFTPDASGRMPVTIRSLMRMAKEGGWDDAQATQVCYEEVEKWLEEKRLKAAFVRDGLQRIAALPELAATEETALLNLLRTQCTIQHGMAVTVKGLTTDLKELRKKSRMGQEQPVEDQPGWAQGFCYVSRANQFYRQSRGEWVTPEAFDKIYGRKLLPTADQLIAINRPVNQDTLSKPIVPPSQYALNLLKLPVVYDKDYDPSQPGETTIKDAKTGLKYVNTYIRSYPNPDPTTSVRAGEILQRHLDLLIAEPEYRRIVLDFLAYLVQHPGEKIRWTLLIQGVDGCGKTVLAVAMGHVLGESHVRSVDADIITSGFNDWAHGHQLVVLEEVYFGDRADRTKIMNSVKPLITNARIPINEKFANSRSVVNRTNYLLFSNHHNALTLAPGDRRYCVIKSTMQNKAQVQALPDGYFVNLHDTLKECAGGLRHFFENWQISPDFNPDGHAPATIYRKEMIDDSATELAAAVRRVLLEADSPYIQFDLFSFNELSEAISNGKLRFNDQSLRAVLHEEGYEGLTARCTITDGDGLGNYHYLWMHKGLRVDDPVAALQERVLHNMTNLQMEMML